MATASPGARGDSPSFATSVRDVQTFVDHIQAVHGIAEERMAVVAQSVGAVLVSTWAHDYAPKVRALVLASPAFQVKLYVRPQRAETDALVARQFLRQQLCQGTLPQSRPAADRLLRQRPADRQGDLGEHPARPLRSCRAGGSGRTGDPDSHPTADFGADFVVHRAPQERFFERLGSLRKEKHILPGFFHDTLGERDRHLAVGRARRFLLEAFATAPERPSLLDADRLGHTCAEAEALAAPLPKNSPRDLYWRATRAGLRLGSLWSDGVKLGFDTGFDSGSTLDYVYRNQPSGSGPLGRLIDRNYLDSIGWRGIRQRKLHAEELLRLAMQRLREEQREVRIVDIAAGHGRYILEAPRRRAAAGKHPPARLQRDQRA